MGRLPEIFYSSCLNAPPWVDDMMMRFHNLKYDNYIKPNCIVKIEKETNKMEAKKCDRCGKLYEQNGDRARVRFKFKEVYGADDLKEEAIAKRQLEEVYIKSYGTELDLCPECKESFKKWFEES